MALLQLADLPMLKQLNIESSVTNSRVCMRFSEMNCDDSMKIYMGGEGEGATYTSSPPPLDFGGIQNWKNKYTKNLKCSCIVDARWRSVNIFKSLEPEFVSKFCGYRPRWKSNTITCKICQAKETLRESQNYIYISVCSDNKGRWSQCNLVTDFT
jgi:hypothetical protein